MNTTSKSFKVVSLNCASLTSAAELCEDLVELDADIYCLQNCSGSRLKTLPTAFKVWPMSLCVIAFRQEVFTMEDGGSANLLGEVLRRAGTFPHYANALPLPFAVLQAMAVHVCFALLRHKPTGQLLIVATSDFRLSVSPAAPPQDADPLGPLRVALCTELKRLIWGSGESRSLVLSWGCDRVVLAGSLVGAARSAAYAALHCPPVAGAPEGLLRTVQASRPRPSPFAGQEGAVVCTYVLDWCGLAARGDPLGFFAFTLSSSPGAVQHASLLAPGRVRLEMSLRAPPGPIAVGAIGTPTFQEVYAAERGEGDGVWPLRCEMARTLAVCDSAPVLLRLTWVPAPTTHTDSSTSTAGAYPAAPSLVLHTRAWRGVPVGEAALCGELPLVPQLCSATAASLTPGEVTEEMHELLRLNLPSVALTRSAECHARIRSSGPFAEPCGEPVTTVAFSRSFSAHSNIIAAFMDSHNFRLTGCQDHIFFTEKNGLRLEHVKVTNVSEATGARRSTVHIPVVCSLAFDVE